MKHARKTLLIVIACLMQAGVCLVSLAEPAKPNILLIVADDLGYSDLGCYGGEIKSPNLDRLAFGDGGVRFTRFYNTGRCCPSRASIMTGQYPHAVGLGHMTKDINRPGYRGRVADNAVTLADVTRQAGYRTFLSGKWHLGTEDPTKHGFDGFYGTLVSAKRFWDPDHMLKQPASVKSPNREDFHATDAVTEVAINFIKNEAFERPVKADSDKPWFLYLGYHAPHFPLHARPADIEKYIKVYEQGWDKLRDTRLARMKTMGLIDMSLKLTPRSRYWDWGDWQGGRNPAWTDLDEDRRADLARRMAIYAAMIEQMDRGIGRIMDVIKERGEYDNTLIMFLSDNGSCAEWDPFGFDLKSGEDNILHKGEDLKKMGQPGTFHSIGSGWANAANTPWRLYKHYCHEGGITTPMIMHLPKADRTAKQKNLVESPSHLIDLMPTVVMAAKTTYPKQHRSQQVPEMVGENLIDLIRGESSNWQRQNNRTLYFEHEGNRAIHQGEWKLVALRDQPWELYDISKDRTELTNLMAKYPFVASRLEKAWDKWAEENHVTPLPDDYQVKYLPVKGK